MKKSCTIVVGFAAAAWMAFAAGAHAQSIPTEKEIIKALSPRAGGFSRTRSFTGTRGVKVTGAEKSAPVDRSQGEFRIRLGEAGQRVPADARRSWTGALQRRA